MTDEKAKYLLVSAADITKQKYKHVREFRLNDFFNFYDRAEKIDANEIFANNGVPEECRIIIVKTIDSLFKKEAEEYIFGYPFDVKAPYKIDGKKYVRMNNMPVYHNETLFNDTIVFRTEKRYHTYNNVIYILQKIREKGCLEEYLKSIREFFDIKLDMDDTLIETRDKRKALDLYRYKNVSNSIKNSIKH